MLAALTGLNSGNANALSNNNANSASGVNSNSNSAGTNPLSCGRHSTRFWPSFSLAVAAAALVLLLFLAVSLFLSLFFLVVPGILSFQCGK